MTTVAIFTRVSKKSQDTDRQSTELKAYARRQGYQIVASIEEKISGSTKNEQRPLLQQLLSLAAGGQLDKVLVSEISRLGRRTSEVLQILEQLEKWGVSVYVLNYNLETQKPDGSRNPMAQFLFTLLAEFARMEKELLVERIHSGLDHARGQGKHLGRPSGSTKDAAQLLTDHADIVRQLRQAKSIRDVAKITGKAEGTVKKVRRLLSATDTGRPTDSC